MNKKTVKTQSDDLEEPKQSSDELNQSLDERKRYEDSTVPDLKAMINDLRAQCEHIVMVFKDDLIKTNKLQESLETYVTKDKELEEKLGNLISALLSII